MDGPFKYPSRSRKPAASWTPDTRDLLFKRSALPKCRRLKATFLDDDDGRYVCINGIVYPALLTSSLTGRGYNEDMRDSADYSVQWCRAFLHGLNARAAAVLVSDADESQWKFLGLFQVKNVRLSSFLTCRLGAKLCELQLLP